MRKHWSILAATFIVVATSAVGQNLRGTITLHLNQPGHAIPSGFFGLMTEEINHSYDGGLYAELIRNRSFRDSRSEPVGWSIENGDMILESGATPSLLVSGKTSPLTLSNSGYWGVPIKPGATYRVTLRAKAGSGFKGGLAVAIQSEDGKSVAKGVIPSLSSDWKTYELQLHVGKVNASPHGRFVIGSQGVGTFSLNYASLFPPTFDNKTNGFRPDLMQKMGAMSPSFLRLPGGNYLEGDTIPTRFEWKDTLGDPMARKGHPGPWGYRSSDGLGLLEFLEWCEELKMKPLLAVYAGYSLRQEHVEPGSALAPYVQDALDEIEYVTGDANTKWGAVRAQDGHPKPFPLEFVEIGNEDWFDRSHTYDARFAQFFDAIKTHYPKLKLISTAPVQSKVPDVMDDHYYRSADDMARDSGHYDSYSRTAPKIFVGEWASTEGSPTPTLQAALGDGAWLTGLERDSDVVVMEAYAPMLVNVNRGAFQWGTNLIGYDSLNSFGSPSYYVQSMFASYTGKNVVPSQVSVEVPPTPKVTPHGAVGLASWRTNVEFKDPEVTHDGQTIPLGDSSSPLRGWKIERGTWTDAHGALQQTTMEENTVAVAGDVNWTDYTYHVKARKLSGDEGFMIPFHVVDPENYWFWNVGGWDNTRTEVQVREQGSNRDASRSSRVTVETGRWYDVKIEVEGTHIRCYLDGKLVTQTEDAPKPPVDPIYAAASRGAHGALYLKVVNMSDRPVELTIAVDGKKMPRTLKGLELTGNRGDVNSINNPTLVAPKRISFMATGGTLVHQFPARSVTVLKG